MSEAFPFSAYSQETTRAKTAVRRFYEYLQKKQFHEAWQMLSTAAKLESQTRYETRLARSTRNLNLESVKTTSFRFFKKSAYYLDSGSELTFVLNKTKEKYTSQHFTLWILENGEWRLDDERSLEPGMQLSQLQSWKLTREKPVVMVPVGITQNPAEQNIETLWLADEKYGNPYLRIATDAGIFQKNGIDLKIRDLEPGGLRVLPKILSGGIQLANINLSTLDKRQIPTNARLVSFSSGMYARVLSSDPDVSDLRDISGKTVGTAGFSDIQVELIKDRLRTELVPKFSGVTVVNAKDSNSSELNNILERANADVFLLHPTTTQSFTGMQYRYITNIKQPLSAIFMTEELQKRNPSVAERFLLSHVESIEYFRKNRAAVIVHLMEHSPNLKVTEAARRYEELLRELPATSDDTFPTTRDIQLFTRQSWATRPHRLESIVEQGLIKKPETKAAIAKSLP